MDSSMLQKWTKQANCVVLLSCSVPKATLSIRTSTVSSLGASFFSSLYPSTFPECLEELANQRQEDKLKNIPT